MQTDHIEAVSGAIEIGKVINAGPRRTFYLLERGLLSGPQDRRRLAIDHEANCATFCSESLPRVSEERSVSAETSTAARSKCRSVGATAAKANLS